MRVCPYTLQLVVTPKEALMAGQEAPLPHNEEEGKSCLTHVALSHETPILPVIHYYSRVLILFLCAGNVLVEVGRMWVSSAKQAGLAAS